MDPLRSCAKETIRWEWPFVSCRNREMLHKLKHDSIEDYEDAVCHTDHSSLEMKLQHSIEHPGIFSLLRQLIQFKFDIRGRIANLTTNLVSPLVFLKYNLNISSTRVLLWSPHPSTRLTFNADYNKEISWRQAPDACWHTTG